MIKVFIPEIKGRVKSNVRGFWRNDKGIIFYDYLKLHTRFFVDDKDILRCLEGYQRQYKQEAIAFIDNDVLKIFYSKDKMEVFDKVFRVSIGKNKGNLRGILKRLLRDYGGVTVYIENNGYILESFYK